jgi:hypothetical protein
MYSMSPWTKYTYWSKKKYFLCEFEWKKNNFIFKIFHSICFKFISAKYVLFLHLTIGVTRLQLSR